MFLKLAKERGGRFHVPQRNCSRGDEAKIMKRVDTEECTYSSDRIEYRLRSGILRANLT